MNAGFVVPCQAEISLFCRLAYITGSRLVKVIIRMQLGCLKICPSGLHSIARMTVISPRGKNISSVLAWPSKQILPIVITSYVCGNLLNFEFGQCFGVSSRNQRM